MVSYEWVSLTYDLVIAIIDPTHANAMTVVTTTTLSMSIFSITPVPSPFQPLGVVPTSFHLARVGLETRGYDW